MTNGHDQPGAPPPGQNQNPPASPPPAAQPCYIVMQPPVEEDEISLLDYWRVLVKHKWLIIASILVCTTGAVTSSYLMTPIYRAEVVLAAVEEGQSQERLSGLADRFSGLAALAGISLGGGGGKQEAIAILKSRAFTAQFIEDEHLLPVLFSDRWDKERRRWRVKDPEKVPTLWDGVSYFDKEIRSVKENVKTGLITLRIDWKDPEQAARWADRLVERINRRMRERAIEQAQRSIDYLKKELRKTTVVELQQAIYRLIEGQIKQIMLANVREEYAFKVVDPAVVPRKPLKPRRRQMVILGFMLGLIVGVLAAFVRHSVLNSGGMGGRMSAPGTS